MDNYSIKYISIREAIDDKRLFDSLYEYADENSSCKKIAVGSAFVCPSDDSGNIRVITTCNNGGTVNCRKNKECYKAKVTGIYESCEETRKYCQSIHSEINMISALKSLNIDPSNGTLYVTRYPCYNCAKNCAEFGFKSIVYCGKQEISDDVKKIFNEYGIRVTWMSEIDYEY